MTLAYAVSGAGPPLVLVPWVPFSNLQMEYGNPVMRRVYEQLAGRMTLIQYDGRGTGHSQRDVLDLSSEAMVGDLEAVVDQLGLKQFSLLGQYSSCAHALAYAARHPDRVTRMALFSGSARTWEVMSAAQTQALLSLIERDWDLFSETAALQWMGWSAGEAGRATAEAFREAVTPHVARATLQAASATDVTAELAKVEAPTLVLHRRNAPQVPVEVSRSLASRLAGGRLVILDGERPHLFLEEPDRVIHMLLRFFLDGIEPEVGSSTARSETGAAPRPSIGELSPREVEVLRLLAAGESNAEIARRLRLSPHTVERHIANIYRKINARGRADATAYALRHGIA